MDDIARTTDAERRCPECGAPLGSYARCEELFHAALAMEWTDPPRTGEAHHLLVATYMLQHPSGFTAEGQRSYREMVAAVVDERLSAPELRERNRGRFEQGARGFDLKAKPPAAPRLRCWRMTIADVLEGPVAELPARVWCWAESAREELRAEG